MSSGILSIGLSALDAAQLGLTTTSQNISNVNTPGYDEESTVQVEANPVFTGAGYVGAGVQVQTIQRAYNNFAQQELVQAQAGSSQLDTYYAQMQQIDNALGTPDSGLTTSISSFFNSVQNVANNPADVPTRDAMLGSAQTLVTSFNSLGSQLQQLGTGVTQAIQSSIGSINTDAASIASLNQQILESQSGASGQPPNTLLDQRDALVLQLNQQIGATAVQQANGTVNVYVGNGQALVLGGTASTVSAQPGFQNTNQLELNVDTSGNSVAINSSQLSGGALTGLLQFNNDQLQPTENQLGLLADNLAAATNSQNEAGVDLNGNAGQAIFTLGAPEISAPTTNSPTAAINVTINNASQLTGSAYQLQYNGTNYTLTRISDNTTTTYATLPQTVDGMTIALASPMAAGDSFTITPTANGSTGLGLAISDPNLIAAATPVQANPATANTGDATIASLTVPIPTPPATVNANVENPVNVNFTVAGGVTTYTLTDPTTAAVLGGGTYTPGTPITLNGWSLNVTGTPANGDTINLTATGANSTDNSNALLMGALQNNTIYGGQSITGAYQAIVSTVGAATQNLQTTSTAQDQVLTTATSNVASLSGVNLDQEAANLLKYQQAYQAASQTIATADQLFTQIITLFNNMD